MLVAAIFLSIAPRSSAQALDIYGGYPTVSCTSGGGWAIVPLYGRMLLCNPLGHAQFGKTIDIVDPTQCSNDQFGNSCSTYVNVKYGSSADAPWSAATALQMQSWGMNGLYDGGFAYIWPTAAVPTKLVITMQVRPCLYDLIPGVNWALGAGLANPIKNVYNATTPLYAASGGYFPSVGVCDFDDPGYDAGLTYALTNSSQPIAPAFASSYHLYIQGILGEETDQTFGYNGGYDFATTPNGHNQEHISMILVLGSTVQTGNSSINGYGVTGAIYSDYFVHQKITWLNDLITEYGTISALNTAWGTSGFYTTFGTSGTCYGVSSHFVSSPTGFTCAANSAAVSTTGSGAGPYTATLSATVSKFSTAVWVGSTMVCGDNGSGVLMSPSNQSGVQCTSSTVNYTTGAVSITFTSAPASSPTIEYIQNGWCVSGATGVMDECGDYSATQGWWGTCTSASHNYPGTSCNLATYGGMNANLTTDVKNYEYHITKNWLSGERTTIKTYAPWVLFIGAAQGSWGTVPDCQINEAMGQYSDVFTGVDPPMTQAMLDFTRSCAGKDVGIEFGNYTTANPDSDLGFQNVSATHSGTTVTATAAAGDSFYINTGNYVDITGCADSTYDAASVKLNGTQGATTATYTLSAAPTSSSTTGCTIAYSGTTYSTQAAKGAGFISAVNSMLTSSFTASGTRPYFGYDIWRLYDDFGQGSNFGLFTQRGNAYDGVEDVTATVPCSAPISSYTCGGELQNYGDLITSVKTANATIDSTFFSLGIAPAPVRSGLLLSASKRDVQ